MSGALTDVAGLAVGHFTDTRRPTGCTVVLCPAGAVAGVDVRGGGPGTRETEALSPVNAVETVHAVLLAGGSAFGLDAAGGVMRWLDELGIGLMVGPARVPIVPAAILFDLWVGDPAIRPDAAAGYAACKAARTTPPEEGNVGAGAGASVGKLFGIERAMRGGLGTASVRVGDFTVAALVAVNAIGDVVDPATGRPVAGARRSADGRELLGSMAALLRGELPVLLSPGTVPPDDAGIGPPLGTGTGTGTATTLAIVATDAVLSKAGATKMAQMAHDGLARSINPVHTLTDGDTVFALATGASGRPGQVTLLGAVSAEVLATAVLRAVRLATTLARPGLPHLPAACDLRPS